MQQAKSAKERKIYLIFCWGGGITFFCGSVTLVSSNFLFILDIISFIGPFFIVNKHKVNRGVRKKSVKIKIRVKIYDWCHEANDEKVL